MASKVVNMYDKMLPVMPALRAYFKGSDAEYVPALYRTIAAASGLKRPTEEFDLVVSDLFTTEEMASDPIMLRFLQLLIRTAGARRVLEVGTFIGVSALYMASALPEDGDVVTIEKFDKFADIAEENFDRNQLAGEITLLRGNAVDVLASLPKDKPFDMIFVDGGKELYGDYLEMLSPILAEGGLLVVDDVFFHGDAVNQTPETEKGRGVKDFLERAARAKNFFSIALPIGNGVMLMMRQTP